MKVHFRQLVQTLGEKYPIEDLALVDLQSRTDRRAKMNGQKGRLSPATIRKEIVTRRTSWNWAAHMGLLKSSFTSKGLSYPKFEERPPFQTWGKIERQIALGRRTKKQQRELWDSLYLTFPDNHLARSTHVERGGFRAYTTTKPE